MLTLPAQLLAAMESKEWSVGRLLRTSRLKCDRSSLHRKLHGNQPITQEELQALVDALEITIEVAPKRRGRAA